MGKINKIIDTILRYGRKIFQHLPSLILSLISLVLLLSAQYYIFIRHLKEKPNDYHISKEKLDTIVSHSLQFYPPQYLKHDSNVNTIDNKGYDTTRITSIKNNIIDSVQNYKKYSSNSYSSFLKYFFLEKLYSANMLLILFQTITITFLLSLYSRVKMQKEIDKFVINKNKGGDTENKGDVKIYHSKITNNNIYIVIPEKIKIDPNNYHEQKLFPISYHNLIKKEISLFLSIFLAIISYTLIVMCEKKYFDFLNADWNPNNWVLFLFFCLMFVLIEYFNFVSIIKSIKTITMIAIENMTPPPD